MTRQWTGKKSPTNPSKKDQHESRKPKKKLLNELKNKEWSQEKKDYANQSF